MDDLIEFIDESIEKAYEMQNDAYGQRKHEIKGYIQALEEVIEFINESIL